MTSTSHIYIVWSGYGPESAHATRQSAEAARKLSKDQLSITAVGVIGGIVTADAEPLPALTTKPVLEKDNAIKNEDIEDEQPPAKKTKTAAQQRADNSNKIAKPADSKLPENVKKLLEKGGNVFEGKTVVVTGVPPTLGRKNTEKLVEAFGAHLSKSLSKKTGYVVIGNEAGPKKLEQIQELDLKTLDEDELIALLENAVKKRLADDDEDDKKPQATRTKRQKR